MLSKKIVKQISEEFNISNTEVIKLYYLWWKEAKEVIEQGKEYTDINIPLLGKLILRNNDNKEF